MALAPRIPRASVRMALGGLVAGTGAAATMIAYAMVAAATYQDTGFFTPLYHIASTFIEPAAMEASMRQAMGGSSFYFDVGPAALGLAVHLGVGAVLGAVFGTLVGTLRPFRLGALMLGLGYGLVMLVAMSFVVLPAAAALFGGGEAISDMADMVGWGTFTLEHLIFGLVLGLWAALWTAPAAVSGEVTASLAR
ncbi:MAG: hypothetical protein M3N31_01580 [Actinomycetota bacterium]|nr:hypothetical protein [Actinomycetota bacterium]